MYFRDNYAFMSNMYPVDIEYEIDGRTLSFTCAEAAFQAAKCPKRAAEFTRISGYAAKRLGRKVKLRPDWEDVKIRVMAEVLMAKFGRNLDLMDKLERVSGPIVEDNSWHDTFWGQCDGKGENWLGRLLEQVKEYKPAMGYGPSDWLKNLGVKP